MAKYRKRPIVVEANQWFKNGDHPQDNSCPISPESPILSEGEVVRYYRNPDDDDSRRECKNCGTVFHVHGWIDTLEGGHAVCPGDWIITGVKGEKYPCKDDVFRMTYEPVEVGGY